MSTSRFFDVKTEIIDKSPDTKMIYLVGQGGVGKSYSVKKYIIKHYIETGKKFIYVRRLTTDVQAGVLESVFYDVVNDPDIDWSPIREKYPDYYRFHLRPKGQYFHLCGEKVNSDLDWLEPIGRITCIRKAELFKLGTYLDCESIFFDEFITEEGYLKGDKEPAEFEKIVGTCGRESNKNLKVFFTGNPDADIEMCPYLYPLHLDYERLQDNTIYYYDTVTGNKTLAANIAFIKIAHREGMLNESVMDIWGTAESHMRMTGEVKTEEFIRFDPVSMPFDPFAELIIETAHITENEYHKKIYAYFGMIWGEPVVVVLGHERYKGIPALFCRYEKNAFRKMAIPQTYRLNIPRDERFAGIIKTMSYTDSTLLVLTDNNRNATLFNQIRINS